jgi:hypothetical protein
MEHCAYLVNSTPKYYYMLPLHFALVRRYADFIPFTLILATEEPDHPICQQVAKDYGVELLPLKAAESGFLESRAAALRDLALTGRFLYVLPMQEDFLLDRTPDITYIVEAISILQGADGVIASLRLMPCPGTKGPVFKSMKSWGGLLPETDEYGFTFQATLWRLEDCCAWYGALCAKLEEEFPLASTSPDRRRQIEVSINYAENAEGQRFFWKFFKERRQVHLGWIRKGAWSNAVYLSPWPYRPTAIVKGRLEPWAAELGLREGVPLLKAASVVVPDSLHDRGRGY